MHYSFGFGILVGGGFITGGLFESVGFGFSAPVDVSEFEVETFAFVFAFAFLLSVFGVLE